MAKRQVFFSFEFKKDAWRAGQVRNMGKVSDSSTFSDNDWEEVKSKEDSVIRKWIDDQMANRSCIVVLIGKTTSTRKWVKYEIEKAYELNKGIVEVRDGISDIRTRFTYDDAGRVVSAREYDISGDEEQHYASFYDTYDKAGRQSSFTYVHGGDTLSYNYGYASNDAPSKTRLPDGSIYKMIYDSLGRSWKSVFTPQKDGGKGKGRKIQTKISYLSTDAGLSKENKYTTALPEKVEVSVSGNVISSDLLAYDELNHVSKWNDTSYEYDSLGRLIKAEDGKNGKSYSYEYDDAGNILSSVDEKGTPTYEYDEKGLLSKYDGKIIGRYSGGNPGEYRDYNLTWTRGRVLDKAISDEHSIQYAYDHSGIRLAKTVDGIKTEYLVNGSTILSQKCGDDILRFYYSADGTLVEIGYINEASEKKIEMHFAVIKNAMGDVVALTTPEGTLVGSYEYDPYGRILSEKSTDADTCGITQKNPFRYRSYYYDSETGWYYLNSRYYDPQVKRFINADDASFIGDGVGMLNFNLYAYCRNNPISLYDPDGEKSATVDMFARSFVSSKTKDYSNDESIVGVFKKSEKLSNCIKNSFNTYLLTGKSRFTYLDNSELNFYGNDDCIYDLDLHYGAGTVKYLMEFTSDSSNGEYQFYVDVIIWDYYDFKYISDPSSVSDYINNIGFILQEKEVIKNYNWMIHFSDRVGNLL